MSDSGFEDVDDFQDVPEETTSKPEPPKQESSGFEDATTEIAPAEPEKLDANALAEENKKRFVMELEFVQSLANPQYLNFLASQNYFNDPAFCRFLQYLLYWDTPKYSKYIRYPQCLFFLHQLQDPNFRTFLLNTNNIRNIDTCTYQYWAYYMRNRLDFTLPDDDKIGFVSLLPKTEKKKEHKKHKDKSKHKDKHKSKDKPANPQPAPVPPV